MSYDPVNDRKSGHILGIHRLLAALGSSGLQLQLPMDLML
jgi:hypothetical protein